MALFRICRMSQKLEIRSQFEHLNGVALGQPFNKPLFWGSTPKLVDMRKKSRHVTPSLKKVQIYC